MDEEKKVSNKKTSESKSSSVKGNRGRKIKNDLEKQNDGDITKNEKEVKRDKRIKKVKSEIKDVKNTNEINEDQKSSLKGVNIEEKDKIVVENDKLLDDDINPIISFSSDKHDSEEFSSKTLNDNLKICSDNQKYKKSFFSTLEVVIIMFIAVMFGLLIGGFIVFNKYNKNSSNDSLNGDLSEFVKVYNDIIDNYYEKVDKDTLVNAAIKGMINELKDPYSFYLDTKSNDEFNEQLDGYYTGIGVEIYKTEGDYPTVANVFDDSPANKAGILPGDKIIKVRGDDITGRTLDSVVSLIKDGKIDEKFNITVKRNDEEIELEISLAKVDLPSVYVDYVEKGGKKIAVISITKFALNTYSQFEKAYKEIKESGAYGIIIDVRGNVGGYLASAYNIASMFVDKGVVVYQEDTKGNVEKIKSTSGKKIDLPVVMLVNQGSASASEVLTISLKENLGVKVVGNKTFGKGTIQILRDLSNGASVKYTIQRWLSPNGNSIDGVGIVPDVEVNLSDEYFDEPSTQNDNQLQAAIDTLLK